MKKNEGNEKRKNSMAPMKTKTVKCLSHRPNHETIN